MAITRAFQPTLARAARGGVSHAHMAAANRFSHTFPDYNDEWNQKWVEYFEDTRLREAGISRGLNNLFAHDVVPDQKILEAAFRCCRRLNVYGPTIRIFEAVKDKVHEAKDYDTVVASLQPIIKELGLVTPEEMGFDKLTPIPFYNEDGTKGERKKI